MFARRLNGHTVRALREALGYTQDGFATCLDISTPYLSNIEAGRKQPHHRVIRKMAERLGVPVVAITYTVVTGGAEDIDHEDLHSAVGDPPHPEGTAAHPESEGTAA